LYRFAHNGSYQSYIRVDVDFESRIVRTSTCRQCKNAACARVCPTGALVKTPQTGIMAVNLEICIGCGSCEHACRLGNVRIIPALGIAGKCDLCGGDPQCVQSCFARALLFDSLKNVVKLIKENRAHNLAIRAIGEEDTEG
jgi:Fe-S-cluster-containing dehydrogenase component